MIPFKAIKYSAVLIILICIQKSLQKEAEIGRRRFDFRDSTRNSLYSNARAPLSKYIQDVRADSRRARIDSRDIRTDFREIMDVSSVSSRYIGSRRESPFDGNRRSRAFARRDALQSTRNRDVARMDVDGLRNQLRGFTTRDSRLSPAREDVSRTHRVSERSFVAADERNTRGEMRSSRGTSALRSGNFARGNGRESDTRESPLSIKRDSPSIRRSLFSDRRRDFSDNQLRAKKEETRLPEREATRGERREVSAEAELMNVRLSVRRTERGLTPARKGPSGLNRKDIGRSSSSERRDFVIRREGRRSARAAASRVVRDADSVRDSRLSTRRNERDLTSARSSGLTRREETCFTRAAATRRDVRSDVNARNARVSVTRTERDLSSIRDEPSSFTITSERKEFYNAAASREESRSVRASGRRHIRAKDAQLSNVRSEERDLPPTTIREDRRISSTERIRESPEIYRKDARRVHEFRTLSRDINNGEINGDLNIAQTMDNGFYMNALESSKHTGGSNIVRNAIEAALIIWFFGIVNRQNVKGGLGVFRSWLQPCKIN